MEDDDLRVLHDYNIKFRGSYLRYMKQNISSSMTIPRTRTVPRYSDKFKDVLQRALKKQEAAKVKPQAPRDLFFYRMRTIGVGAFSFVYLVGEEKSATIFAQKSISKKKVSENLFMEIKLHLTLSHPNIIELYHIYSEEDYIHLIMEYAGESLFTLRKNQKLPMRMEEQKIISILRQILNGLSYLHSRGFVHADIKLENVLYQESVVKLCDFGYAHRLGEGSNDVIGTMEYLSPQYVQGRGSGFERDIWAVGIIAFQLLTGKNPLEGLTESQKWSKMLKISALPLAQLGVEGSPQILQLLQKCLCDFEHRLKAQSLLQLPLFEQQTSASSSSSEQIFSSIW